MSEKRAFMKGAEWSLQAGMHYTLPQLEAAADEFAGPCAQYRPAPSPPAGVDAMTNETQWVAPAVTDEMLRAARDTLPGGFTDICDADLEDIWEAMHRAASTSSPRVCSDCPIKSDEYCAACRSSPPSGGGEPVAKVAFMAGVRAKQDRPKSSANALWSRYLSGEGERIPDCAPDAAQQRIAALEDLCEAALAAFDGSDIRLARDHADVVGRLRALQPKDHGHD